MLAGLARPLAAYDIPGFTPNQIIPFKQMVNSTGGAVTLNLHVFTPPGHKPSHQRPAIVFFFGGGWVDGSASRFHPQCEYLASRGMVAISAEYRVKNLHGTTPQPSQQTIAMTARLRTWHLRSSGPRKGRDCSNPRRRRMKVLLLVPCGPPSRVDI